MTSRAGFIIVLVSLLSLTTLTVSCRQHRTSRSISFERVSKSDNNLSDKVKNFARETNQDNNDSYESLFIQYIPAPLSDCPEQIICRKAYFSSYNKETKLPNWVAWHLASEHTDGLCKRLNTYFEDLSVPSPRATEDDYRGTPWTHGHMCPAGDNKWDEDAMRESNILTNICPQSASLNSGLWNRIEQDCRKWAKQYGDLFIVCGPVLYNKEHETIGTNKIIVPEAFFKVLLCLQGKPKAIGFVIKNIEETNVPKENKKKTIQYVNTVDEVERITGIDFFPALPDDIENEVEANANLDDWR